MHDGTKKPKKWQRLARRLRYNQKIIEPRITKVERGGYYVNSVCVRKQNNSGYGLITTTVWSGSVVDNFCAFFDENGNWLHGEVNCFGLGIRPMDEQYIICYISEMKENFQGWELIHW